jgi:hypothetical protein
VQAQKAPVADFDTDEPPILTATSLKQPWPPSSGNISRGAMVVGRGLVVVKKVVEEWFRRASRGWGFLDNVQKKAAPRGAAHVADVLETTSSERTRAGASRR